MENIGWIILITFIAGCFGTGIGGLIGALTKKDSNKIISLLLSFAGGIMLAVVCFDLLSEAVHPIEGIDEPPLLVVGFTFVGFIIVAGLNYLIDKKLSKEVPHTSSEDHPGAHDALDEMIHADHLEHHRKSDNHLFIAGLVMVIVIALHNLPEGMVIGASYAKQPDLIVGGSGLIISIVIGLHNIPEGMAVSVPLISGGAKKVNAVLMTAASGIPTVIGAVIGFSIGMIDPIALSISLSLASGAMLYVVFCELIPESVLMWKSKLPGFMLLVGLLLGFVLVLI
ncbi:MAG: ZIP family metal transporter [Bacilli bacterium]|nr:ZIP family metal transporter [Bacilli bacterium]